MGVFQNHNTNNDNQAYQQVGRIRRPRSEYHNFITNNLSHVQLQNPNLTHRQCFEIVVRIWRHMHGLN